MLNRIARITAIAIALATAATAAAETPAATGSLRYPSTNASWGTFEVFTSTANSFGFWLRLHPANGHVMTVQPYEVEADGQIAFWYIEYAIAGAGTNLDATQGWQWTEVAGGRILLNPATATATTVDGSTWETYEMVGYTRNPVTNPRVVPIRLSVP